MTMICAADNLFWARSCRVITWRRCVAARLKLSNFAFWQNYSGAPQKVFGSCTIYSEVHAVGAWSYPPTHLPTYPQFAVCSLLQQELSTFELLVHTIKVIINLLKMQFLLLYKYIQSHPHKNKYVTLSNQITGFLPSWLRIDHLYIGIFYLSINCIFFCQMVTLVCWSITCSRFGKLDPYLLGRLLCWHFVVRQQFCA